MLETKLRDGINVEVKDVQEIVNLGVISSPPLHAINFAVIPSQELSSLTSFENWFKSIYTHLKDFGIEFHYYPFEWKYHEQSSFDRDTYGTYLNGFTVGCMKLEQVIGNYERVIIQKHRITLNIDEGYLANKLNCDENVFKETVEESRGKIKSEDESLVLNLPNLERFIFITPYMNLAHFGEEYCKTNGDFNRFQISKGGKSVDLPHSRSMKIVDARRYLSENSFKQFMEECRQFAKSKQLRTIYFDGSEKESEPVKYN